MAYILWVETPKGSTTKGPIKPKQKHYKNYKRVLVLQSEANLRSLLRSWSWFHQLLWNPSDNPEPRLHHCILERDLGLSQGFQNNWWNHVQDRKRDLGLASDYRTRTLL